MWARKQELLKLKYSAKKYSGLFFLPLLDEPDMMILFRSSSESRQRKFK